MITPEEYLQIKVLRQCGFSYARIATKSDLAENTVIKYEKEGYLPAKQKRKKGSKLDPFKEEILDWISEHPDLSSVQIEHRLKEQGYDGGNTTVKNYLRKVRLRTKKAYLKLNFPIGDSMQVDWGEAGTIREGENKSKVYFFVAVMSHSRAIFVHFTRRMSMEFWLECHRFAFEYFGGVPQRVIVDNCKTAVLKNKRGLKPQLNKTFVDFADHYGFTITACNVRQPQEKGRVENGVNYSRRSFIIGRNLVPFDALKHDIKTWMDEVANVRIHGTTGKKPIEELEKEREHLRTLNLPYDCSVAEPMKVSPLCRIRIDNNFYSVPSEYVGETVTVRRGTDKIRIFLDDKLLISHTRSFKKREDVEAPEHAGQLLAHRKSAELHKLQSLFLKLDPVAEEFFRGLIEKRFNLLRHLRKLMALGEIHGTDELVIAIGDAVSFKVYSSDYIENILENRQRHKPQPGVLHVTHKKDMLNLKTDQPDMDIYSKRGKLK